jgi:hypothetical protein
MTFNQNYKARGYLYESINLIIISFVCLLHMIKRNGSIAPHLMVLPIFIVRARSDLDARLVAWQARRLADDATRLPKTRELLRPGRAVAAASDGGRAVRVAAGVARAGD